MTVQEYFDMVDNAYYAGSAEAIEKGIKEAVDLAAKEYGKDSNLYASMLSELGGFYRGQTRYEESRDYFLLALDVLKNIGMENTGDYATGVNNLAGTYRVMGEFKKAEECFSEALDIYRNALGEKHILYASGLNNLGLLALDQHDSEKATRLFNEASSILKEMPEALDEYTTSLVNTASLYYQLGELELAEKNLTEAIDNYETKLGTFTPHYHSALNTLGLVFSKKGDSREACRWFAKSAEAAQSLYSSEHKECLAARANYENEKAKIKE